MARNETATDPSDTHSTRGANSRLEALVARLAPRRDVRVLLIDGGDGVAVQRSLALDVRAELRGLGLPAGPGGIMDRLADEL